MNSRISWLALAVFVVGCGTVPEGRERNARDPVTFCSGLDRTACGAAPECYVEPLACITLCVDDGFGNCGSPCASDFRCLARPTTCESLGQAQCEADSRCEYVEYACTLECRDDGNGGCLPCNAPPSHCRTRPPATCEQLSESACVLDPRCEVVHYACTLECRDDGNGGCLPCNAPPPSCRTRTPTPGACAGLDAQACAANPRCELLPTVCTAECRDDGNGGCLPCNPGPAECVERTTQCYGLDVAVCASTPGCELVSPVCSCAPNSPSCDCLAIAPTCVPSTTPAPGCYGLDEQACGVDPRCEYVHRTCPPNAVCEEVGACIPRQPSECEGLDPQVCVNTPGCGLLEVDCACPPNAVCDCTAPAPRCVSTVEPTPNPCVGLDLAQCTLDSRCEIGSLACTAECRDDGQGGCLPCPDVAVCQLRYEPPVIGCGGTPPPSP